MTTNCVEQDSKPCYCNGSCLEYSSLSKQDKQRIMQANRMIAEMELTKDYDNGYFEIISFGTNLYRNAI